MHLNSSEIVLVAWSPVELHRSNFRIQVKEGNLLEKLRVIGVDFLEGVRLEERFF